MIDTRELILARLLAVLGSVTGIAAVVRDALDATGLSRPAAIMQSGDEEAIAGDAGATVARASRFSAMQFMTMTPIVDVYVFADATVTGSVVAAYRTRIIDAVLNDATLRGYVGSNGNIRYRAFALERPSPEARERRASLAIEFTYPFRLADMAA